jgi:hypothetical protein
MDILYLPFKVFIQNPFLALLPTGLFAFGFVRELRAHSRRWTLTAFAMFFASVVWLSYCGWEVYISHAYPPEKVPIRIDLLVIAPALWVVSALAVIAWVASRTRSLHSTPR